MGGELELVRFTMLCFMTFVTIAINLDLVSHILFSK